MIVKMKFLSISGPKNDIDRVCEVYLSKDEMQLENAAAELKTTDNLQPFVEDNPYKEPLAKAEQFNALLSDEDQRIDASMNQDDMLNLIRDVNHDYLDLVEKKELTKKQVEEYKEKLVTTTLVHCGKRFLLPYPIRFALATIESCKYIWKGIKVLCQRKIEVPVLDATAISVSMLRGDIGTAGSVMFLLNIGEILEEWTHKKSVGDLSLIHI